MTKHNHHHYEGAAKAGLLITALLQELQESLIYVVKGTKW